MEFVVMYSIRDGVDPSRILEWDAVRFE